jgi:glycosyltransferase involved in cell wall biosynthesis
MNNSKSNIILTIGIPVFNGENFIGELLESINIPENLTDKIEVIVSDNCSTDKTIEIASKFSNVIVLKNESNIGYDANAFKIYNVANGEYVWTIGSDDVVLGNNTFPFLIDLFSKFGNIGVIHVGGNPSIKNNYNVYNCDETFFIDSNFKSGFASSNIVNRKLWLNADPISFIGSGWVHFGVILKIVNKSKCVVVRDKFVDENPNFSHLLKTWDIRGSSLKIMLELVKIFGNSIKYGYTKKFVRQSKLVIKNNYPKEIIKSKANGLNIDFKLIIEFINCYKSFPSFWLIDLPFLLMPNIFSRAIYSLNKFIKSNK